MEQISPRLMSWAIDPRGRHPRAGGRHVRDAVHLPARRAHARRPPGQGRRPSAVVIPTLGAIIPAAVGVDIGCGMIAVRTQYTAADLPGRPARRCGRPSRRRCRSRPGSYNSAVTATTRGADRRPGGPRPRAPVRPGPVRRQLAAAARHARLGQPLHRGQPRRGRPGVAVPALGLPRRRQQDRPAPHRGRAQQLREQWWITLPDPDLAYLVEGTDEFWAVHPRAAVGAALRPAEPRGDDGPRRRLLRGLGRRGRRARERSTATTTTPQQETHFGKDVWLSRKGAIDAARGRPG